MASDSFRRLLDRLDEVRSLQSLIPASGSRLPATPSEARAVDAVNRASVVMLCSHLEGYVEDLLLEAVDRMATARMPLKRLPTRLRYGHAFRDVRDLAATTDPDKFVTGLDALVARNGPLISGRRLEAGLIDGDRLRAGFATPTSDAIKSLISLVGVEPDRVLSEVFRNSPRTRFRVTNLVNAMVARRQEVAHGDMNASVTQADVLSYLTAVHMLGARLDAMVGTQLAALHCRPWT